MRCPYTDKELKTSDRVDHIVPLSLGGCDHFIVRCSNKFNHEFGSRVEQKVLDHPMFRMGKQPAIAGHRRKKNRWLPGNLFDKERRDFKGRPVRYRYGKNGTLEVVDERTKLAIPGILSEVGIITHFPDTLQEECLLTLKAFCGTLRFFHREDPSFVEWDRVRKLLRSGRIGSSAYSGGSEIGFTNATLLAKSDPALSSTLHATFKEIRSRDSAVLYFRSDGTRVHFSLACRGLHIGSLTIPCVGDQIPDADSGTIIHLRRKQMMITSFWNYMASRYKIEREPTAGEVKHESRL